MREATEQPTEEIKEGEAPSRLMRTVLPLLVVGGLLLAHLEVLARGPGYAGPLLVLDHLFDLGLAILAMALFVAAGWRILRLADLEPAHPCDVLLYSAALGPGLWSLVLLTLGLLGSLSPWALSLVAIVGVAFARQELRNLPELVDGTSREIRESIEGRWLVGLGLLVTGGVAAFLVLHGSAPPGDWDSLMYHLEIPRQWLAQGQIFLPDGNLHAAFVSVIHMLYVPFLALGSQAAPALLNVVFAVLLGLTVFRVGQVLFDTETGLVSSMLIWSTTGLMMVAVTARVDTTLAFYLLLGQSALALALTNPGGSRDHLMRAAAVLGVAAGVKYHGLAFAAALAPIGAWALWKSRGSTGRRVKTLAVLLGVFLVGAGPWAVKNIVLLGEPLYPFFADRLLSPWLADLYGTREVVAAVGAERAGILGEAREPFDIFSLFLAPERLTVEQEAVHYNMNPLLLVLLPLWALHWKRSAVVALAGPALLYGAGLGLGLGTINLRYLFPVIAPLTVVTTYFAVDGLRRLSLNVRVRRGLLAAASLVVLIPTGRSAYQWTAQFPVISQAIGSVSSQTYLQRGFGFYAGLAGLLNTQVPAEGRVLLLWEARAFYLVPDVLPDNVLTNWPLLAPWVEGTGRCLEGTGITHVLASTGAARYYEARGANPERLDLDGFRDFADRCLIPMNVGAGFGLYRVRGTERVSSTARDP